MTASINTEKSVQEHDKMNNFVLSYKREAPSFYDENVCEEISIQVPHGTITVYHHKPKKTKAKRPIVFIPGFGTASLIWREFHFSHHGDVEYYHIEGDSKC